MQLSARNQLRGTVNAINRDGVMAEVVVDLGAGNEIVAAITRASAEHLGLATGKPVTVVIKATEVIIGAD